MAAPSFSGVTVLRNLLEGDPEGVITEINTASQTNVIDCIIGTPGLDSYFFDGDAGIQTLANPGIIRISLPDSPQDFSNGELIAIAFTPEDSFRFDALANRGIVIRVYSDSGFTEYREWIVFGGDYSAEIDDAKIGDYVYFLIQVINSSEAEATTSGFNSATLYALDFRFVWGSTASNEEYGINGLLKITPISVVGGDSVTPANKLESHDYLINLFNNQGEYLSDNLSGGTSWIQRVQESIGDGSTATYHELLFNSIIFSGSSTVAGTGWLRQVWNDESNGIIVTQSSGCYTRWIGCFFTSTQPYALELIGHSSSLSRLVEGGVFQKYGNAIFDTFIVRGATFAEGITIDLRNGTSFTNNTVRDATGDYAIAILPTTSIKNCSFVDNVAAIQLKTINSTYALENVSLSGNTYDFEFLGGSGETAEITVDADCTTDHPGGFSDSGYVAAKVNAPNGGSVTVQVPQSTLTFNDCPTGTEIRVYSLDAAGVNGNVVAELGGIESTSSSTFTANYSGTVDVRIVILNQNSEYVIIHESLTGSDRSYPVGSLLKTDRVFENPD